MRLRVMTFNVRYLNDHDGANVWSERRDLAARLIREKRPDVFGTQELRYEQGQDLVERLPEYSWFGVDRRANGHDEHMGVFYRRESLTLLKSGNYWLSETPQVAGSRSWGINIPRMVTWGVFQPRTPAPAELAVCPTFYFYNTHFPHRRSDVSARLECATILMNDVASVPLEYPVIVAGDFNEDAGSGAHELLVSCFADVWLAAAARSGPATTFHGFGRKTDAFRIDWILYRGRIQALCAETVTTHTNGLYPSDHYPVFAELELGNHPPAIRA